MEISTDQLGQFNSDTKCTSTNDEADTGNTNSIILEGYDQDEKNGNRTSLKRKKKRKASPSTSPSQSQSRQPKGNKKGKKARKSDTFPATKSTKTSSALKLNKTKRKDLVNSANSVTIIDEMQEESDAWLYGESDTKVEPIYHPRQEENQGDLSGTGAVDETEENEAADGEVIKSSSEVATDGLTEPNKEGTQGKRTIEEADEGANDEGSEDDDEDEDSDDDDDGVQVVIGDIKAATVPQGPANFASKRPVGPPPDKKGKFSTEDFEATGTINGVPAQDFSLDSIEEKPWRKPGADLTDYFNYGFTEETWRAYCDRQKRLRYESGSTIPSTLDRERKHHPQVVSHAAIPIIGSDNSKYSGPPPNVIFPKKFGMPDRSPKEPQRIIRSRADEHRENTIQVMTADRREYSRKAFDMPPPIAPPFDMSVPPPPFPPPDPYRGGPGPDFFSHPPPTHSLPPHPPHPPHQQQYFHGEPHDDYEEHQWMDSAWEANMKGPGPSAATTVVPLTKISNLPPPPGESDDLDKSTPPIKEEVA